VTHRSTLACTIPLIAVLAAIWLGACGEDAPSGSARSTSSTAPAVTSSSTSTTTSSTTTQPRGEASLLTDDDAVLVTPSGGKPVEVDSDDPCAALTGGGTCAVTGDLMWAVVPVTMERSPVTVYRVDGSTATPVLVVEPESRAEYASARVEAVDLDDEPGDELVVGLRNAGTGGLLQIDVVGVEGAVVAHVTLDRGRAALDGGVLRTWGARYLPDDPNCCPSRFQQAVVVAEAGAWSSVAEREVAAEDVPAGDFP
jgi:hypothetical protein